MSEIFVSYARLDEPHAERVVTALRGAGYKVWRDVFVGPEASLYRTEDYREWRVGAHATGVQLGRFTFRLSTGWRRDESSPKGGPYGGLSVHVKM